MPRTSKNTPKDSAESKVAVVEDQSQSIQKPPLPPPSVANELKIPYAKFFPTMDRYQKPPAHIFDRWREIWTDTDCRPRIMIYVYQLYPIIDTRQTMTPEQRMKQPRQLTQVFKIPSEEEPWTFEDFCRRAGYGSYRLKLNDQGLKGTQQTWTEAVFDQQYAITEWDKYPPMFDPDWLVMDDPRNASFIRLMRTKGGFMPSGVARDGATADEEEDMANTAVVEKLVESMQAGQEHLMEVSEARVREAKERTQSAPISPADNTTVAERTGIEMMKEVVSTALDSMRDVNKEINKVRTEAAAGANGGGGNAATVLDTVTKVVQLVKPPDNNPVVTGLLAEVAALRAQLANNQEKSIEAMREEMRELRKGKETPPAVAAPLDPFDFLKKAMGSFRELREEFGPSEGSNPGNAGVDKYSRWMSGISAILQGAGGLAQNIFYGLAVGKSQAANAANVSPTPPGGGSTAPPIQTAPVGLPPGAPGRPPLTPEQEAQMAQMEAYKDAVTMLEPMLLRALDNGMPGNEFAVNFVNLLGESAFSSLRDFGGEIPDDQRKIGITNMLAQFSQKMRARILQAPQQWERFLNEFLSFSPEEDEEPPEPPTPGPQKVA